MKESKVIQQWGRDVWQNTRQVLSLARVRGVDITVDLFSSAKRCPSCHLSSSVFVGPTKLCAHCWSGSPRKQRAA